jgi:alpha-beta hydrolase superfamily lysophospholipase
MVCKLMMVELGKSIGLMDRPEILGQLFFPHRASEEELTSPYGENYPIEVEAGIFVGCRFYPARIDGSNILCFHGTGEIAQDYDYVAHFYQERGLNLFVADYRGYGMSGGTPTCKSVIGDAHVIFQGFVRILQDRGYTGNLFVMGRSLGSAPAIEVAYRYQRQLGGLIVESGFASTLNQLKRLGAHDLIRDVPNLIGFGNDLKIKEVTIPTLIIHGQEDERISVEEGRALYSLSGAARKEALFIPHTGHNDLMVKDLNTYMGTIQRFAASISPSNHDK